ncbi:hypothetical protein FACS1894155_00200 [Bacteroidia bacterium]|nr:hypothetical protein FACS189455_4820 [Bacteroidia bacterium]GHU87347.1 hypothetical protein FACS1894155_00200 [Bacteroidia bacterium]
MNILPSEFIKNGIDIYLSKHAVTSRNIYLLVLFVIVFTLILLPFIYVDVSVRESGIIRPAAEKTEITASITEWVDSIYVREGESLKSGDTILTFVPANPDFQIKYQQKRLEDLNEHLEDLRVLVKSLLPKIFRSATRKQEYFLHIQRVQECTTVLSKAETDLKRHRTLYDKGIISGEEYENYQYEYNKAKSTLITLKNNQLSQWQNDLNTCSNSLEELRAAIHHELKEKDRYVVTAPVNGTLDQFHGIYKSSLVQSGSLLAVISPDSTLYAEVYVSPRNIGYIHINMPVSIQVASFNYNEWGSISGSVKEISSDFMTDASGQNACYKVKCSLNRCYLVRKNKVKGLLKKGMTISVHFMITRRSFFDLLYQKMDDWVNPTQYNVQTNSELNSSD